MPELPEVETIARRLREVVVGKTITKVAVLREKSFLGSPTSLEGATITGISRRSKIIQFEFDRPEKMLVHLKMTGQLIYQDQNIRLGGGHPTADWVNELPSKYTRVILDLAGTTSSKNVQPTVTTASTAKLFFNDLRVFGWLKVMTDAEVEREFSLLGPDIIDPAVSAAYLFEKLHTRGIPIKQALMDNSVVAGVGNIYANDALHLAGIDPFRPAKSLSFAEVAKVYQATLHVVRTGIELGGATMHDYRHVDGFAGQYQTVVRTYGREGEPCLICGTPLLRKKQAGRSTFYCTICQK